MVLSVRNVAFIVQGAFSTFTSPWSMALGPLVLPWVDETFKWLKHHERLYNWGERAQAIRILGSESSCVYLPLGLWLCLTCLYRVCNETCSYMWKAAVLGEPKIKYPMVEKKEFFWGGGEKWVICKCVMKAIPVTMLRFGFSAFRREYERKTWYGQKKKENKVDAKAWSWIENR